MKPQELFNAAIAASSIPVTNTSVVGVRPWPALLEDPALYGVAGDLVRAVAPHSEADPAGLLIHVLVAFGNIVGRGPHFWVGGTAHRANLNAVVVGTTASRKGTARDDAFFVIRNLDTDWYAERVQCGLSSGEGLIWAVRDPIAEQQSIKEKGRVVDYQDVIVDSGVLDKRLLLVEPEFGSTLRVMERDGNTLSAQIRQAWDEGNLRIITKNKAARATGAHISILGHITREELLKYLAQTEQANGFANRFLWVCVRRSRLLPDGGDLKSRDFTDILERLRGAVTFARSCGEVMRTADARRMWHAVYGRLSADRYGLLGAVTSRAEAQVGRLSLVYALLDKSPVIDTKHLEAALALWAYCENSARFIFGEAIGDAVADDLLTALRARAEGMTRTDISEHFGRNRSANQIGRVLTLLSERGLVRPEKEVASGGRPPERWFAVTLDTKETNLTKVGV